MAEELKRMDDRSRKKQSSDVGAELLTESCLMACDRLTLSYPSPRVRSSIDRHHGSNRLYGAVTKQIFGSPSYPSPLDRIRTGRRERAKQMGLPILEHDSFEANQSFPKIKASRMKQDVDYSLEVKKTLDNFNGDGLNDVSYTPGLSRGSFTSSPNMLDSSGSLGESWSYFNYIGGGNSGVSFPTTVRNPNKAIVTINAKTSEILVANEMASELFGFTQEELIGIELNDLVTLESKPGETIAESHLEDNGEIIEVSGKVVDAIDSSGLVIPISLWIKRLDTDKPRCLVVMEPLEKTTANVTFDSTGTILDCDCSLAILHGYSGPVEMMGLKMNHIIPSLRLPEAGHIIPEDIKKQRATGRTKDGATFPLSVYIERATDPSVCDHNKSNLSGDMSDSNLSEDGIDVYYGIVLVFANISGLITVLPSGKIHSINNNFALMLFGFTQSELIGKDISEIIPHFHDEVQLVDTKDVPAILSTKGNDILSTKGNDSLGDKIAGEMSEKRDRYDENDDVFLSNSAPEGTNTLADVSFSGYMNTESQQSADKECGTENKLDKSMLETCSGDMMEISVTNSKNENDIPSQNLDSSPERARHQVASSSSQGTVTPPTCRLVIEPTKKLCADNQRQDTEPSAQVLDNSKLMNKSDSSSTQSNILDESQSSIEMLEDMSNVSGATDDLIEASEAMIKEVLNENNSQEVAEMSDCFLGLNCDHSQIENSIKNNSKEQHDFIKNGTDKLTHTLASTQEIFSDIQKVTAQLQQSLSNCLQQKEEEDNDDSDKENKVSSMDNVELTKLRKDKAKTVAGPPKPPRNLKQNSQLSGGADKDASLNSNRQQMPGNNCCQKEDKHLSSGLPVDIQTSTPVSDRSLGQKQSIFQRMVLGKLNSSASEMEGGSRRSSIGSRSEKPSSCHASLSSQMGASCLEGSYLGKCRHKDGSELGIVYQVKQVQLADGQTVYCIWVSRDPGDPGEGGRSYANLTMASSFNDTAGCTSVDTSQHDETSAMSLGAHLVQKAQQNDECCKKAEPTDKEVSKSRDSTQSNEALAGTGSSCQDYTPGSSTEYDEKYETLNSIGKGAFGFVKLAMRKSDGEQVVVKFIKKSKLSKNSLVDDPVFGRIPSEVSLLSKLKHPNIVTVLDCFEGPDFYHLVMEKHGSGMDLFEFIDRCPNIDEALASYIFRQLVSAVSYLLGEGIIHRDIKDENVILNEKFEVKLIDFGSAAYLRPDHLFATFCGTIEYCCPEVLQGNKYKGPELEVWCLGVTLYTLIFGENPFFDIEETIKCQFIVPFEVSEELVNLIYWMLNPNPEHRATIKDVEQHTWVTQPIDIDSYSWEHVLPNCEFNGNTAADNREDSREDIRGLSVSEVRDSYSDEIYLNDLDLYESFKLDFSQTPRSDHDSENSALEMEYKRFLEEEMSVVDDLYSEQSCHSNSSNTSS